MAKRISRVAILFLALFVVGTLAVSKVRAWIDTQLSAPNPAAQELVLVQIAPGSSTADVASTLHSKGLIRDPRVFGYYARYKKLDAQMQSGDYELSAAMTPDQILQKLAGGQVVVRRFTVPEGLTVAQVGGLLAQQGLVNAERFASAARQSTLAVKYTGEGRRDQPLEGYLFPSTYDYRPGITEQQVIEMMFAGFERIWTPEMQKRANELKLTVHEVITLASIIEEEARVAKERGIISGVYHNRLRVGMKLDADPTVRYVLNKPPQEILLYKDLEIESPYNTYRVAGLPPGPISAPGLASIQAALNPAAHDLWYFVAKEDGSGEHYFAESLAEHEANTDKAAANQKK